MRSRSVWILCLALIFGSCVFLVTSPELVPASSSPEFQPGDCVASDLVEGVRYTIVRHLDLWVVNSYLVEDADGTQQAFRATELRPYDESR